MSRKQQYLCISMMMMLLATVTCRVSGSPASPPGIEPTRPATDQPLFTFSTPTVSAGNDLHTIFPSFSLTDPNTVCVAHSSEALSCLDATGWHVYKDEYDGSTHMVSTIPMSMARCPDGRIYLIGNTIYRLEGETLVDIGGYVDQGTIVCGSGNELWVSDISEVSRFDGSTWIRYSVEEYFESHDDEWPDSIGSLAVAPNGNIWVTTNKTIATFDGTDWKTFAPPGNPTYADRNGLAIDSSGVVWAVLAPDESVSDSRLLKYDGTQWTSFPSPDGHGIESIALDHENRVWAIAWRNKIYTLDSETNNWVLQSVMSQIGLAKSSYGAKPMQFDGQDRLWLATDYGVGVYDGLKWTTYHFHTANLYSNDTTDLVIFGNVPQLPAQELKAPGSVQGKLVSRTSSPFADAQVAICLSPLMEQKRGDNPCADQAFNAVAEINPDGNFVLRNIPAGDYYLVFKLGYFWSDMVSSDAPTYLKPIPAIMITVSPGTDVQLGEITTP